MSDDLRSLTPLTTIQLDVTTEGQLALRMPVPNDTPPFLCQLSPAEGRNTVDKVQSGDLDKRAIDQEWITVEGRIDVDVRAVITP